MPHLLAALLFCLSFSSSTAQQNLDSLRAEMLQATDASKKANILDELSYQWFYDDLDSSLHYGLLGYTAFLELDDPEGLARAATSVAVAYHYLYDWDSAEYFYQEALKIRLENESDRIAASLNNLGVVSMDQEKYEEATNYYLKAMEVREQSNDSLGVALTKLNLGLIFKKQGNFDKAIIHYLETLSFLESVKQTKHLEVALLNLGAIYNVLEQYDIAKYYNLRLQTLAEKSSSQRNLAKSYVNLANTYEGLNALDSSLYFARRGLAFFEAQRDTLNMASALLATARVYQKKKQYNKAISTAESLSILTESTDNKELAIDNQLLLAQAYGALGDFEKGQLYMKKAFNLKDSFLTNELNKTINELTLKYETEQKEREISELKIANQESIFAEKEAAGQRNFLILIAAFLSLSAVLLYLLLRTKSKANSLISLSLHEKETLLKEIHHRVKNNLQVISSLLSLQSRFIEDKDAKALVNEGQNRVKSMALIHQKLYQKDNLTGVEVLDYIENLSNTLISTYSINTSTVNVSYNVEKLNLDVDTMIPVGLILNELISNAFKHAFPTGEGELIVAFKKENDQLVLQVTDNGVGAKQDIEKSNSFGMRMIQSLSKKLEADVSFDFSNGTSVKLAISNYKLV